MVGPGAAAYMRGPLHFLLQSSGGQWFLVGLGAFTFFPEKVGEILRLTFDKLTTSESMYNNGGYPRLNPSSNNNAPIIIHTGNDTGGASTRSMINITMYVLSAAGIWISYNALRYDFLTCFLFYFLTFIITKYMFVFFLKFVSNLLPESIKELLPVTRKIFDKSITNVAKAIINVREALGKQIMDLSEKQDLLNNKQDQTLIEISNVQENMDHVRNDLDELGDAMSRCETSLEHAERLQSYTARGIKLLVKTVATMIPGDHRAVSELSKYTKEGEYLDMNHNKGGQQQSQLPTLQDPTTQRTSSTSTLSRSNSLSMNNNPQDKAPIPTSFADPEKEHPMGISTKINTSESPALKELLSLIHEGQYQVLIPKVGAS